MNPLSKYEKRQTPMIHKDVVLDTTPIVASNERTVRFCISNETVDSDADLILVDGWDLSVFKRNPVCLWGHDKDQLPVGKVIDIGIEGRSLMATVEFVPPDVPCVGPHAEAILQLLKQGFLSGCSVGFVPTEYELSDRMTPMGRPGLNIKAATLYELSIVTIPANADCLVSDRPQFTDDPLDGRIVRNQRLRRQHKALLLTL